MIEDLRPYERYQPTSSRWIGRIPVHWELHKLRTLITAHNERNRPDLPLLSVARERGVFVRSSDDDNHNVIPEDLSNYKVARTGCLVINKMKAWQGSMGIAPCDGIVSPAYFVYDFRIADRAFGQALLRSRSYVAHFAQASDGVRIGQWDLSIAGMREIPIALPPQNEQAAIVRFLDHANRRIDRFIRAKKKLIALLNEQKQAIIHRAVTRGLDSNVPMKDSGVHWLGKIPRHWSVVRNMALFALRVEAGRAGLPILQVSLHSGVTEEPNQFNRPKRLIADVAKYKLALCSDIAYNTMRMWQGALGVVPYDGLVSPAYVVIKPREAAYSEFYSYLFRTTAYMKQVNRYSTGIVSDRNRLYWDNFKEMPNIVLPRLEQEQIVHFIAAETKALNSAISNTEREISLIREYRTRLIADVVTGQLDVREAAAKLPIEEPEADDMADVVDDEVADQETEIEGEEYA